MSSNKRIKQMCDQLLHAMINNSELELQWWLGANRGFSGQTPLERFQTEPKDVLFYLMTCAEGGGS